MVGAQDNALLPACLSPVDRELALSRRLKNLRGDMRAHTRFVARNAVAHFIEHRTKQRGRFGVEHRKILPLPFLAKSSQQSVLRESTTLNRRQKFEILAQ